MTGAKMNAEMHLTIFHRGESFQQHFPVVSQEMHFLEVFIPLTFYLFVYMSWMINMVYNIRLFS